MQASQVQHSSALYTLCFIFGGFKPARLRRSATHGIYCQASNTLYNPWSTGEYMPECCWMFKMFTLKMRSAVNVWHYSRCFARMLVVGFPLARIGKLPKNSEWQWPGKGALLSCSSTAFLLGLQDALPGLCKMKHILALEKLIHHHLRGFCVILALLVCLFGWLWVFSAKNIIILRNPMGAFAWLG